MSQLLSLGRQLSRFGVGIAMVLGLAAGLSGSVPLLAVADTISELFVRVLRLISLPIIFLSITSTCSGMESIETFKTIGRRIVKYTLLTTLIASSVALILFVIIDPASTGLTSAVIESDLPDTSGSYAGYLIETVPANIVRPFLENNVIGVLLIAMALGISSLTVPQAQKEFLHNLFSSLFSAVMRVTSAVLKLMPIAVWAFVAMFVRDVTEGLQIQSLGWYLLCVVLANVVQALVVLPLLLKSKGINPFKTMRAMAPALNVAFFAKSSSAALPMAMRCAEEKAGVPRRIASLSLPLCTTINMNACAAFILITVLFVSMSHGVTYTFAEMLPWVLISTLAAVGNAGVPMGCYFLSSALLASMGVPLNILGIILPVYAIIDMLESAINVWSDSCVTAVVAREEQMAEARVAV